MKKVILLGLLALTVNIFVTSCNKERSTIIPLISDQTDKKVSHNKDKDKKCKPLNKPCPPNPYGVGMMVSSQGYQVDGWVEDLSLFFVNYNNPAIDTCGLKFTINNIEYLGSNNLPYADSQHLGTMSGTIGGLPADAFQAVTKGFHLHQRCDCDSSYFYSSFNNTGTMPVQVGSDWVSVTISGNTYYAANQDWLAVMVSTKITKDIFSYQLYKR